jgi:isoleucyl-tRNA synthetase
MAAVREVVSLGLSVRTAAKLKVRQPLELADVIVARAELAEVLGRHGALVAEELNVHRVELATSGEGLVKYVVKPNFKALGKRLGKQMQAVKAALATADGGALRADLQAHGRCSVTADGAAVTLEPEEVEVAIEALPGFAAASGRVGVVVLSTTLTPELVQEGLAREVLSRLQGVRKELGLAYTARIALWLRGSPEVEAAVTSRREEIAGQVLATELHLGEDPPPDATVHDLEVDETPLRVGVRIVR